MALTLKITVGCRSSTDPSNLSKKNMYTRVGLLGPYHKKRGGAVGTSTRAHACTCAGDPQPSSYRRRCQTGETPEKLAHVLNSLVRVQSLSGSLALVVRTWTREVRGDIFKTTRWTVPNSQVLQRTVMASGAPSVFCLQQTVAVDSCTTRRQRIAQTATMHVIDPPRGLRHPQKAQPLRGPLQFRLGS